MLEAACEYAFEQLREQQERDILRKRHACYYIRFADQADAELRCEYPCSMWIARCLLPSTVPRPSVDRSNGMSGHQHGDFVWSLPADGHIQLGMYNTPAC